MTRADKALIVLLVAVLGAWASPNRPRLNRRRPASG